MSLNDIIKLLRSYGYKVAMIDTTKNIGFKATKVKEVIEVKVTNTDILKAINTLSIKVDNNYKELSTRIDNNYKELSTRIDNNYKELKGLIVDTNSRLDNLVLKNSLIE